MIRIVRFVRAHRRVSAVAALVALLLGVLAWMRMGPIPAGLLDSSAMESTVVVDRFGVPLYEARSADGTRGVRLTAATLPPVLVDATIAAEDRRFRSHPGVDPIALARALRTDLV